MAANLIETVKGMLTPEVGKAAEATGESPEATLKAMRGAVPAVVAGFCERTKTPDGSAGVFTAITGRDTTGHEFMHYVLGDDRVGFVSEALAKSSGIKTSSAFHDLSLVFPMVASELRKEAFSHHLTPAGLGELLFGHKKAIVDDPDAPPGLAEALGVPSLSMAEEKTGAVERHIQERHIPERHRPSVSAIFLTALALACAALAVWGMVASTRRVPPRSGVTAPQLTVRTPATPTVAPGPAVPNKAAPAFGPLALPGGNQLEVDPNGAEAQMARYLDDSAAPIPHTFEFNALNFEPGTANLTPESTPTVDNLATILSAYPSARVRLVGNTDSIGDPEANLALSRARADVIANRLMTRGVARDRIETSGTSPTEANEPQAGRARNRLVDVILLSR
jgi:outer membrane protein OmpA-like peptidoglycan-associated protein